MKFTLIKLKTLFIIPFLIYANGVSAKYGQKPEDQKIKLKQKNVTVKHVMEQISKETGLTFTYNPIEVPQDSELQFSTLEPTITEILELFNKKFHLEYSYSGQHIILKKKY